MAVNSSAIRKLSLDTLQELELDSLVDGTDVGPASQLTVSQSESTDSVKLFVLGVPPLASITVLPCKLETLIRALFPGLGWLIGNIRTSSSESVCRRMPRDPIRPLEIEGRECAEVAILEANMSMLWLYVMFECK